VPGLQLEWLNKNAKTMIRLWIVLEADRFRFAPDSVELFKLTQLVHHYFCPLYD